jgi:NADH-quinone oxidoreductase subunit G
MGHALPYDTLRDVRARMAEIAPHLADVDEVTPAEWQPFGAAGAMDATPFATPIANFYMTDAISRASPTMAECSALFTAPREEATGTDG